MGRKEYIYNPKDTICAVSTPVGEGGIGIVRLSGKGASRIADKVFKAKDGKPISKRRTYTVHYGHIVEKDEIIDEVIVTVMRAPKTYTREDVIEINCHGGIVCLRRILDLVVKCGARLAEPGEFTKRAFLNGRIDLVQAEAVLDIIRSKTERSAKNSIGQLEGRLSCRVRNIRDDLIDVLSELEASIDFAEENLEFDSKEILRKKLSDSYDKIRGLVEDAWKGLVFKEGVLSVILGKPNVGKSSLMNAFLRRQRVIVTPVPGTTRDAIEEVVNIEGIPLRIVDTAGIAKTKDPVEKHGITRSKSYIKEADIIIFMLDSSDKWSKEDADIFRAIKQKELIVVANKSDRTRKMDFKKVKKLIGKNNIIEISVLKGRNLDALEKELLRRIWHGDVKHPEGVFISNIRHKSELEKSARYIKKAIRTIRSEKAALPEIISQDTRESLYYLNSILGEALDPDIFNRIFSKFCVGK